MPDPKIVEVDEAELLRLRRTENTLKQVIAIPAAKKQLGLALRHVAPDDPIAKAAEQVDPNEARFDELAKKNAELEQQLKDDKAEREKTARLDGIKSEQERGFQALRDDRWTEDGIAKVKKVMEDKGILDVAIAANWIKSQMPPQNPLDPSAGGNWNFMSVPKEGDDDLKALIESKGENTPLVHKMAMDAISEVRGSRR